VGRDHLTFERREPIEQVAGRQADVQHVVVVLGVKVG
jgi:hypothetical protein